MYAKNQYWQKIRRYTHRVDSRKNVATTTHRVIYAERLEAERIEARVYQKWAVRERFRTLRILVHACFADIINEPYITNHKYTRTPIVVWHLVTVNTLRCAYPPLHQKPSSTAFPTTTRPYTHILYLQFSLNAHLATDRNNTHSFGTPRRLPNHTHMPLWWGIGNELCSRKQRENKTVIWHI